MKTSADLVILGGAVYTAEAAAPFAEAVAVRGEHLICVGARKEASAWIGGKTEVVDASGGLVIPAFRDAHIHPLHGSLLWVECPLAEENSVDGYLEKIAAYSAADAKKPAIRGNGWRQGLFPPQGPHRALLDPIVPDRPVYLTSLDGHSAWVNSAALRLAGLDRRSPDPSGGRIERDQSSGEPTGTLREWPAMSLVSGRLPPHPRRDLMGAMEVFMEMAARAGIVAVHDAAAGDEELETYAELSRTGALTLEVGASLLCRPEAGPEQIEDLVSRRRRYASSQLKPFAAKIFLDGVIESRTAFLSAPYADQPEHRGTPTWEEDAFHATVSALARHGFSVHIHAVGDEAIRLAIAAFQRTETGNLSAAGRHQIAHLDLLRIPDMDRLRRLNIIANMQPAWFYADESFSEAMLPALGRNRSRRLYRLHTLLNHDVRFCLSSDWPYSGGLSTFSPLEAIQVGLTRKSLSCRESRAFIPGEKVELRRLIDGFTIHGAFAAFREQETGSLKTGKWADLVVLDRNLFTIPPEEVGQARILRTLARGRTLYRG
ncbi:MAG: amidohydrolase [Pseudomonadota bacterium]|nr:amidohydrolase [Pseudomonadota bacterium]